MDGTALTVLANMGFAALAAGALWTFVQKLIPELMDVNKRLVEVVQQNSKALAETSEALKQVVGGQAEQAIRLGRMDDRLLSLEEQHRYGVRECPLLKEQAGGKP